METTQFVEVFLLAQVLGLCVYKLAEKLGPWSIGCGILTPPVTFVLVQCARLSQAHLTGIAPNSGEEAFSSFFTFLSGVVTLLIGVVFNLAGATVAIFLMQKLAPASPPSFLEK